jgi:hypothetical protein
LCSSSHPGSRSHAGRLDNNGALSLSQKALIITIPELKAVLLIRDQDDQPERRMGLDQARCQDHSGTAIIVGLAIVERECWVISGFDPQGKAEAARLEAERTTLGFNPCERSHELTA